MSTSRPAPSEARHARIPRYWLVAIAVAIVIGGGVWLLNALGPLDPTTCHLPPPNSSLVYLNCDAPHPFDAALGLVPGFGTAILILSVGLGLWVNLEARRRR
jgi:hypothetical protein